MEPFRQTAAILWLRIFLGRGCLGPQGEWLALRGQDQVGWGGVEFCTKVERLLSKCGFEADAFTA